MRPGIGVGPYSVERVIYALRTPESVRPGLDGRYYVSEIGEFGGPGDGRILAFDSVTWDSSVVADGLNDPKGMAFKEGVLHVTDVDRVVRVAEEEGIEVVAPPRRSCDPRPS